MSLFVVMADVVALGSFSVSHLLAHKGNKENFTLGLEVRQNGMNKKCHSESPNLFLKSNNSEALDSLSKHVIPKNMLKSEQWAL